MRTSTLVSFVGLLASGALALPAGIPNSSNNVRNSGSEKRNDITPEEEATLSALPGGFRKRVELGPEDAVPVTVGIGGFRKREDLTPEEAEELQLDFPFKTKKRHDIDWAAPTIEKTEKRDEVDWDGVDFDFLPGTGVKKRDDLTPEEAEELQLDFPFKTKKRHDIDWAAPTTQEFEKRVDIGPEDAVPVTVGIEGFRKRDDISPEDAVPLSVGISGFRKRDAMSTEAEEAALSALPGGFRKRDDISPEDAVPLSVGISGFRKRDAMTTEEEEAALSALPGGFRKRVDHV